MLILHNDKFHDIVFLKIYKIISTQNMVTYRPLLGNDSVNIFPPEAMRATIGRLLLDNGSVNTPKTIRDNIRWYFP
jgi:hypothetical protein